MVFFALLSDDFLFFDCFPFFTLLCDLLDLPEDADLPFFDLLAFPALLLQCDDTLTPSFRLYPSTQ